VRALEGIGAPLALFNTMVDQTSVVVLSKNIDHNDDVVDAFALGTSEGWSQLRADLNELGQ
jgi:hypothetical protein